MNAQIFVHVGPPKTATTSFQIAMQETNFDWLYYGGVQQPRAANDLNPCNALYTYAAGVEDCAAPEKAEINLGHFNVGRLTGSSEREIPGVSLRSLESMAPLKRLLKRSGLRKLAPFRATAQFLRTVPLKSPNAQHLKIPSQIEKDFSDAYERALSCCR